MTVVVKLGSSLVAGARGTVRRSVLRHRATEIAAIVAGGESVAVVSSGAIALGLPQLGLERRPRALPKLQAASALGQSRLQQAWERALAREGVPAAQILLTAGDVGDRAAYVNARHAMTALFALGAVPIVNENDATATDEIAFGDNDALAAHVAILVRARLLVLLTEVDGVYTRAPGAPGRGGRARGLALSTTSPTAAGRRSDAGGCRARSWRRGWPRRRGSRPSSPEEPGRTCSSRSSRASRAGRGSTVPGASSPPTSSGFASRRSPSARLHVDAGARRAVAELGRSLLAVGVARCDGRFDAGDAVELVGPDGIAFARGVAGANAVEIAERPVGLEAVHRDRLVVY